MIPFAKYRPDVAPIDTGFTSICNNVTPSGGSFRPFPSYTAFSNALTAKCQGAISAIDTDGIAYTFAGDASKLYRLTNSTFSDVSKVGGYSTPAPGWFFDMFGRNLIAVNGVNTPQNFLFGTSSVFADLGGSPPVAKYIAVCRDFVFLGNISGFPNRVQWSGFNNSAQWTAGTNQSDFQDLLTGGDIKGMSGGETITIFMRDTIHHGVYVGGDIIFQFDEIGEGRGCIAQGSIARVGDTIYFIDRGGFYMLRGQQVAGIGHGKVDRTFIADLNQNFVDNIVSVIDMENNLIIWSYPSIASTTGLNDKIIIYNWVDQEFAPGSLEAEYVFRARTAAYTLEGLDALGYTLDTLPFSLDSSYWAGGVVSIGAFNSSHILGYLTGTPLAATLATPEVTLSPGRRAYIDSGIPIVDTSAATVAVAVRERYADALSYGDENTVGSSGYCGINRSGRTFAARVSIPAGTIWTQAEGIHLVLQDDGVV